MYSSFKSLSLCLLLPLSLLAQLNPDQLQKEIQPYAEAGLSAAILVAEKGKPVFLQAYGYKDFEKKVPLSPDDIFELASVSKQFTAMIIMMLEEQGRLGFDDSIDRYISVPYRGITIRHLLNHTSGLPDYQSLMDQYWDKSRVAGNPDILSYLNRYTPPVLFEPGTRYEYSNTGYVLLGSIAEKVSSEDFITLCSRWIFNRLHMSHTAIRSLAEKAKRTDFAWGHIFVPERKIYVRADSFPESNYTLWLGNRKGPGRVSSTAEDLLLWDQALYTHQLVSSKTLRQAFAPAVLKDGTISYYGFGWVLDKSNSNHHQIVFHTGDNPGYATKIVRFLNKRRTLIVLCNNAFADLPKLLEKLEAYLDKEISIKR
ncbi:MAG: serine hydrolase domain-containing protein [Chitinophagaceae bacterium]